MRSVLYLGLAFVVLGGMAIWDARRITTMLRRPGVFDFVGPDYFFLGVGVAMATVGVTLMLRSFAMLPAASVEPADHPRRYLTIFAVTTIYVVLIWLIGYALATAVFFAVALYLMGTNNWRVILASSVSAAVIFYFLFVRLADMPLPKGILMGLL